MCRPLRHCHYEVRALMCWNVDRLMSIWHMIAGGRAALGHSVIWLWLWNIRRRFLAKKQGSQPVSESNEDECKRARLTRKATRPGALRRSIPSVLHRKIFRITISNIVGITKSRHSCPKRFLWYWIQHLSNHPWIPASSSRFPVCESGDGVKRCQSSPEQENSTRQWVQWELLSWILARLPTTMNPGAFVIYPIHFVLLNLTAGFRSHLNNNCHPLV